MKSFLIAFGIASALLAAPALGVSGGQLATLERGPWACEMPGDAGTTPGLAAPEADFTITNGSTYHVPEGHGTYLRTGDQLRMTSGPRQGDRYAVQSEHFLRKLDQNGNDTGLRCIKLGEAGSLTARATGTCPKAKKNAARAEDADEPKLALDCSKPARPASS